MALKIPGYGWAAVLATGALIALFFVRRRRQGDALASVITRDELWEQICSGKLDNDHPTRGFALVDVLHRPYYEAEHIPGAINIPFGDEDEYEHRFDKRKEIIVYDATLAGDASSRVAERLRERGFMRVRDFEGGLDEWRETYDTSSLSRASTGAAKPL